MQVVMIEPIGYSGIRYYTEQLIRHLLLENVEVSLITARDYERLPMAAPYHIHTVIGGCNRSENRIRRGIDYAVNHLKVARIINDSNPDLVHFQDCLVSGIDLLLMLWLKKQKIPFVYTVHDLDRAEMKYTDRVRIILNRAIYRNIYHQAQNLIVHTNADMQRMINEFGVTRSKISLIEYGNFSLQIQHANIPTKEESRRELGIPINVPVGLFFGDQRYSKGLDILFQAIPRVLAEIPEFRLIIAGETRTEYRAEFLSMMKRVDFQSSIIVDNRFIPAEEVPKYFAASDMVILPYRSISQSAVVHLAFSLGRPVVASRIGGLAEVVEEGITGIFVDQTENPEELASKIIYAAKHLDWLAMLGQNALRQSKDRFSWHKIAKKTKEVYLNALSSNQTF